MEYIFIVSQANSEQSKSNLFTYFHDNYTHAAISTPPSIASPSAQTSPIMGSQKSFTAQYHRKEKASINKLEEYFKLPAEDFDACNPIQWWMCQHSQFPNLFHLVVTSYIFLVSHSDIFNIIFMKHL
jgi:hypothetical protein